jgi:3-phosphoglycerate kinase
VIIGGGMAYTFKKMIDKVNCAVSRAFNAFRCGFARAFLRSCRREPLSCILTFCCVAQVDIGNSLFDKEGSKHVDKILKKVGVCPIAHGTRPHFSFECLVVGC